MHYFFVDESGDLGQHKGYFIIALLQATKPSRLKNIIKKFCAKHKVDEAHAVTLTFPQKQFLINALVKQPDYRVSYIVADKKMIKQRALFANNNLLYNYLFSFLVKDICQANTDDIHLCLDNRTQKVASVNSLQDYIKIKAYAEWGFTKKLTIEYYDSRDCKVLQMADQVASAVRRRYYHQQTDFYNRLTIDRSIWFPYDTFRPNLYAKKLTLPPKPTILTPDVNPLGSSNE